MAILHDLLPIEQQLTLATLTQRPDRLADLFAAFAGQFSAAERATFDALARRVHACYAATSPNRAATFGQRLDRRLRDRHRAPVAWEVGHDGCG